MQIKDIIANKTSANKIVVKLIHIFENHCIVADNSGSMKKNIL